MPCIVNPNLFPSKKVLLENIKAGLVEIEDPSIFNHRIFNAQDMEVGESIVVTNHPKRSKFACVKRFGPRMEDFKVT